MPTKIPIDNVSKEICIDLEPGQFSSNSIMPPTFVKSVMGSMAAMSEQMQALSSSIWSTDTTLIIESVAWMAVQLETD